jgi:hypothetical protein
MRDRRAQSRHSGAVHSKIDLWQARRNGDAAAEREAASSAIAIARQL